MHVFSLNLLSFFDKIVRGLRVNCLCSIDRINMEIKINEIGNNMDDQKRQGARLQETITALKQKCFLNGIFTNKQLTTVFLYIIVYQLLITVIVLVFYAGDSILFKAIAVSNIFSIFTALIIYILREFHDFTCAFNCPNFCGVSTAEIIFGTYKAIKGRDNVMKLFIDILKNTKPLDEVLFITSGFRLSSEAVREIINLDRNVNLKILIDKGWEDTRIDVSTLLKIAKMDNIEVCAAHTKGIRLTLAHGQRNSHPFADGYVCNTKSWTITKDDKNYWAIRYGYGDGGSANADNDMLKMIFYHFWPNDNELEAQIDLTLNELERVCSKGTPTLD